MSVRLPWLATTALALSVGAVAAPTPADGAGTEDPWKGKSRHDVIALLGEPSKAKHSSDGEVIEYRLLRVTDDATIRPDLLLLEIPGVGWAAKPMGADERKDNTTVAIVPTEFDRDGRPVGGGMQTSSSHSVSWDPKSGEKTSPEEPPDYSALKKMKLTFKLDKTGVVVDWSVSPKK